MYTDEKNAFFKPGELVTVAIGNGNYPAIVYQSDSNRFHFFTLSIWGVHVFKSKILGYQEKQWGTNRDNYWVDNKGVKQNYCSPTISFLNYSDYIKRRVRRISEDCLLPEEKRCLEEIKKDIHLLKGV